MDPISGLIALWLVAVFLTTRLPKLLTESPDGDIREAYARRLKRLEQAGIEPASKGGPLRRFLGDAWRDFLADRHDQRKAAAAASGSGQSWWSRQTDRALNAWRERHRSPSAVPDLDESPDADSVPGTTDGGPADGPTPVDEPTTTGDQPGPAVSPTDPDAQWETETVEDTAHWGSFDRPDNASDRPVDPIPDEPIRVESTTGDPLPDEPQTVPEPTSQPALPQGEPDMTAVVHAGEVTGVVSGAASARHIQRQVAEITAVYVAALRRCGIAIAHLADQAQSTVQLRGNSAVVGACIQAAESTAAAMGYANGNASEVQNALQVVAVAFDRLNS